MVLRETQKTFYALNLDPKVWEPSVDDEVNILKLKISDVGTCNILPYAISSYDPDSNSITDSAIEMAKSLSPFQVF